MKTSDPSDTSLLHLSVRDALRREICDGKLKSGGRLEGERQLARRFGVSRWTVIEALKLLEADGLITRIACRGAFASPPLDRSETSRKLLFFLPSSRIDESAMGFVDWNRYTELSAGIMEGTKEYGLDLSMIPLDQAESALDAGAGNGAAAAVFYSPLPDRLINRITRLNINGIVTGPNPPVPGLSSVLYHREQAIADTAGFILRSGCRSVGFLSPRPEQADRVARIKLILEMAGVRTAPEWIVTIDADDVDGVYRTLAERLPDDPARLPELLYCDRMIYPLALMRLIYERRWRLGTDLKVMAFTCRTAIQSICPELTYTRIPYFEMGMEACAVAVRLAREPGATEHLLIPGEIVAGRSLPLPEGEQA